MLDLMTFHHIGIAVRSIDHTAAVYINAGYNKSVTTFDPVQNVNICWLIKDNMPILELLEPVDDTSPVCKWLDKNGVSPYHICYIVSDLEHAILNLRKMKYLLVTNPAEAVAIQNSKVVFLYNKNVGLVELVEEPAQITF